MSEKQYHSHAEQQAIVLTARRELFLARLATLPVAEQSVSAANQDSEARGLNNVGC